MRAVRLHQYGQRLVVEEVAEPRVDGPWDVIVKVGAAGLCRTGLHIVEGRLRGPRHPALLHTIGQENAGCVEAFASAVSNIAPGDTVIMHPVTSCGLCPACRIGDDSHCTHSAFKGLNVDGGMAGFMRTNARAVVKLDSKLEPRDIAALADAGLTACHAVRKATPSCCRRTCER